MKLNVDYIAQLARIKLMPQEEDKFSKDLGKVLDYFKELQELDTEDVKPLTGGAELKNVLRDDMRHATRDKGQGTEDRRQVTRDKLIEAFPDGENGFLKVPPVLENKI